MDPSNTVVNRLLTSALVCANIMAMTLDQFRVRVASYLIRKKIAPTAFGRKVLNDPAWVSRLMAGFEPKERTRQKVLDAMRREQ